MILDCYEHQGFNTSMTSTLDSQSRNPKSPSQIETIKFNVGGQIYEVSRSLLDLHSDTMLARSASTQWHKDRDSEIFIDRDGTLFNYVLKYLRDIKISVPLTISKNDLLNELAYYGVKDVVKESIDDSESQSFHAVKYFNKGGQVMRDTLIRTRSEASDLNTKRCCLLVVADCIETYMHEGNHVERLNFTKNVFIDSLSDDYFAVVYDTRETSIEICNKHLFKLGLRVCGLTRTMRYLTSLSSSSTSSCEGKFPDFGRGYSYELSLEVIER